MKKNYELNLSTAKSTKPLLISDLIDAEKLIRLNPIWTVLEFKEDGDSFHVRLKDYSSDVEFELDGEFDRKNPEILHVNFSEGDYHSLSIAPGNDMYTATVVYSDPEFKEESEQERHTVLWLRGIQEYLRLYQKKTINTIAFRYIMNRIVLKMNPSQRKISLMLLRITAVELLVILVIVVGYVFFVLKPLG